MASATTDADLAGRPCLEQRFSALLQVRTTLHDDGLVIQVARPFRERIGAVDFARLVLEPASVNGVRADRLWLSGALLAGGVLACLPFVRAALDPELAGPLAAALLVAAALAVVAAVAFPRRLTLLLDRERALNPVFLRGGADDEDVESFLAQVRRAAIDWRCRAPVEEPPEGEPAQLSATLDALAAMRDEGLLQERELARFRDLALHRR